MPVRIFLRGRSRLHPLPPKEATAILRARTRQTEATAKAGMDKATRAGVATAAMPLESERMRPRTTGFPECTAEGRIGVTCSVAASHVMPSREKPPSIYSFNGSANAS